MHTDPKKDRTPVDQILLEQFRRKGYKCEEIEQQESTIFIITHERKLTEMIMPIVGETYTGLFKAHQF